VKGILRSSDELRDLLKLHNQEAMRQGIDELVGIPADFDLRKYQETLREQYGNLKLESLDTSAYAYNDLKLWRMFIPQDVRTCQEFNPKVYEIPKEKLKELQQRGNWMQKRWRRRRLMPIARPTWSSRSRMCWRWWGARQG
jgi:hypothetical protein